MDLALCVGAAAPVVATEAALLVTINYNLIIHTEL